MSLRDVERAMNVIVWFYNHRDALNPLMDDDTDEESDEDDDSDDEYEQDELEQVLSSDEISISSKSTTSVVLAILQTAVLHNPSSVWLFAQEKFVVFPLKPK